ncbi:host attachment protein [Massilia sp. DD77]|uniref:host attachment protein n=1 Tax=Massilia sp. DD77 TaxID=3109349 RepID=UPI002FFDB554
MSTTWIVSADAGRARIFAESDANTPLQEVQDMVNPAARTGTTEELTDRMSPIAAGSSSHGTGGALPTKQYQPQQTPEQRESQTFASEINDVLLKARQAGQFDRLALVAEPQFLGALRNQLDPQLKACVSYEIDKDYAHSNGQQLRDQIRAHQAKG